MSSESNLAADLAAAGIREGVELTAASRHPGLAGPVLRALSSRARRLDDELSAYRKREAERDQALKRPGASANYGDALMLFAADGSLAWRYIVPFGENFAEDIARAGGRSPVARIELLREAPPPPQELMAAQLAAIRKWAGVAACGERDDLLAILNWQEVP